MIFSLIYNKRQTQLLLDCEYFQVLLRPPVLWVLGSDRVCNGMSSQAAVQVWASLPLLVLVLWAARSFWLPPCAPTLLSTRTTSEGFVPTPQRCTACQLGISLCFFFFFWFVFPCPVSQEQKYLLSCTARVPKAVGSCTGTEKCVFGRNGLCHVWIL